MKYEITDKNEINIWLTEEPHADVPNIYQPSWPDGTPWESKEQAEIWAQKYIANVQDHSKPKPGPNPFMPELEDSYFENVQVPMTGERLEAYIEAEVQKRLSEKQGA